MSVAQIVSGVTSGAQRPVQTLSWRCVVGWMPKGCCASSGSWIVVS